MVSSGEDIEKGDESLDDVTFKWRWKMQVTDIKTFITFHISAK